jgi:AcrR family transcriptional regulator
MAMKHYNVKERLIEATIRVIAAEGMDKTTTKIIAKEAGLFETYIYQYFSNKENLLAETFDALDTELMHVFMKNMPLFDDTSKPFAQRSREYFLAIWEFMTGTPDRCTTFVRYYYSPYFNKYSAQKHAQLYAPLKERCEKLFRPEANIAMLLCYMLSTLSMFVQTVIDGRLENNEDAREHVFLVIYNAVSPYFK